jgi:hypothetical protein
MKKVSCALKYKTTHFDLFCWPGASMSVSWETTDTGSYLPSLPREILQEIQRLRVEHEQASQPTPEKAQQNPTLLAELRLLR